MYLKKVLNQPNLVGTVMIALLLGAGFVYAFAFDGFNMETVPGAEVDAWLAQEGGGDYGGDNDDTPEDDDDTPEDGDEGDPCKCAGVGAPYGDCNCGNQIFRITKRDRQGSWKNPCGGADTSFPCPACTLRDKHISKGDDGHCPCDDHPGKNDGYRKRATWTLCKASADYSKKCKGKCKNGKKD